MFGITSPAMDRLGNRMQGVDMNDVARKTAVKTAGTLVRPLATSLRRAGGAAAASDVRVHDGHLNELVMREAGQKGDVIVGVGGDSRHADEAEELEWGSLYQGPAAWVRTTAAHHAHEVVQRWSSELTRELDRRCR